MNMHQAVGIERMTRARGADKVVPPSQDDVADHDDGRVTGRQDENTCSECLNVDLLKQKYF